MESWFGSPKLRPMLLAHLCQTRAFTVVTAAPVSINAQKFKCAISTKMVESFVWNGELIPSRNCVCLLGTTRPLRGNVAMIGFSNGFLIGSNRRDFTGNIFGQMRTSNYGNLVVLTSSWSKTTHTYLCILKNHIAFFEIGDFKHLRINFNTYVMQNNTWIGFLSWL